MTKRLCAVQADEVCEQWLGRGLRAYDGDLRSSKGPQYQHAERRQASELRNLLTATNAA